MADYQDLITKMNHIPGIVTTIDSHTEGEATRLIVDGPAVPGATMMEKLDYFKTRHDRIRTLMTREPRGSRQILAAMVTESVTPGAAFGLIYMDAKRYPYLCGHATIGAVVTLAETGVLQLKEGDNRVLVDTPSGIMDARTKVKNGRPTTVAINMVPAFVYAVDQTISVPGFGTVPVDIACTGGFFAMVDARKINMELSLDNKAVLTELGMKIIDAANEQLSVVHPENPSVNTIDVTEFYTSTHTEGSPWGRGVVIYGESHMDRSPCGTGTAAKMALLSHHGKIGLNQPYKNLSPLDTSFDVKVVEKTRIGSLDAYVSQIRGRAWITGIHHFVLADDDPFQTGYLI